ncbi:hypothetical protein HDV00_012473 [Rhizophlyctis rosea]|nr:hypothetical protein HDV00_012473 [Rhizophlyctis rosea]
MDEWDAYRTDHKGFLIVRSVKESVRQHLSSLDIFLVSPQRWQTTRANGDRIIITVPRGTPTRVRIETTPPSLANDILQDHHWDEAAKSNAALGKVLRDATYNIENVEVPETPPLPVTERNAGEDLILDVADEGATAAAVSERKRKRVESEGEDGGNEVGSVDVEEEKSVKKIKTDGNLFHIDER